MKYRIFVVLIATVALGSPQAALKRTVLQQGDLSAPGREGVMMNVEFPPGASTGRHTHPGDELSYVVQGTLRLEIQGQPPRDLRAGDTLMVPAGVIHNAANTGSASTVVIATYFVEKGKPLASPALQEE
jgi:quercetin dioxygenase-like cupin family protein